MHNFVTLEQVFIKNITEMAENQTQTSSRDRLLAQASEWYPERRFKGQIGPDGQDGQDELADAVEEKINELLAGKEENDKMLKKLVELLDSDPRAANVFLGWLETGDPISAMIEEFGDDVRNLGEEDFQKEYASWRERREANDRLTEEANENLQKTYDLLNAWGDAKGLSLEQKRDVFLRLASIAYNGIVNKYTEEDFDLAYRAMNYEADVENARREGEVAGRNEKIAERRRERSAASTMPPTRPGGQGAGVAERKPKPQDENIWSNIS